MWLVFLSPFYTFYKGGNTFRKDTHLFQTCEGREGEGEERERGDGEGGKENI